MRRARCRWRLTRRLRHHTTERLAAEADESALGPVCSQLHLGRKPFYSCVKSKCSSATKFPTLYVEYRNKMEIKNIKTSYIFSRVAKFSLRDLHYAVEDATLVPSPFCRAGLATLEDRPVVAEGRWGDELAVRGELNGASSSSKTFLACAKNSLASR